MLQTALRLGYTAAYFFRDVMSEEVIAEFSCENLRLMSLKVKSKEREEISNKSGFCIEPNIC